MLIHDRLGAESDGVVHMLSEASLVLANLETTLATKGYPAAKHFNLWAKHSVVEDFRRMGIRAIALANNHAMDFDFEGLFETIEVLGAHGIASAGAGHNLTEALKPVILKLDDLNVAFIACSCQPTGQAIAREDRPGLVPLRVNVSISINARDQQEWLGRLPSIRMEPEKEDLNRLIEVLRTTKDQADIAVVSIHWGDSPAPMVCDYQLQIAHALIDNGADIIMGHGPHVLHGIEVYNKRFVFYSLGHLIFQTAQQAFAAKVATLPNSGFKQALADPYRWRLLETAIGKVVLEGSEIKCAEIIPVKVDQNGNPVICDSESAKSILCYLALISRYLGTSIMIRENRGLVTA
jgi:poly-gamma-glutamate synthesis protein (capsule biosynthesis protein)